ncbi:substrate-binding domain-containing protein [Conexibacter woesei]|uniref:substrate-binding domain-containing protein n=1 Tax=Conexibacter woesei TaxID=191495 RepID=UPI000410CCD5|nr:substrate-binding domain-containing protein [Conexibacter woesei]
MKLRTKKVSVLALAATAAMALSGIGAGSAHASFTPCAGSNIAGEGSSLQRSAQTAWTAGFRTSVCATPTVTYTATSSGRCMDKWGASGGALQTAVNYCGTDDAPTSTQVTNINTATGAGVLSIPVTQAAIAIVVNPPAGCTITEITPANLERVFNGTTTAWSSIATGGSCTGTIDRVVRTDSSGTSYQLKHYLFNQNSSAVCGTRTWADLQASADNTNWPSACNRTGVHYSESGCPSACAGAGTGSGGGDEAKTVSAKPGTIGYVALSDARSIYVAGGNYRWIGIRIPAESATYDPSSNGLSTTVANSNCTTASRSYASGTFPLATASWSGVYLTDHGSGYPICTLTWDLATNNYAAGWGSPAGGRIANTVFDYLNYTISTAGATANNNKDYQRLPTDVRTAAQSGVNAIG